MTYLVKNKEWQYLYCSNDDTDDNIIRSIVSESFVGKFNKEDHNYSVGLKIENDSKLYITRDIEGHMNIWQIGSKMTDMEGFIVPHVYKVRKIGILIN